MKKTKLIFCIFILAIIFLIPTCFAGEQELKSLEYDVTIDSSGNMYVMEYWDLKVYDTNTVFKTFEYDTSKFSDVSVVETTDGQEKEYYDVQTYMYHVNKGGFYGLENSSGQFEIAWNVDSEDKTSYKTYKISYTVKDIMQIYNDCAELYWQFIGMEETIPAKNVSGKIKLPSGITNEEDLRVWAHGPLNGDIHKSGTDTVTFNAPDIYSNEFLEVRVTTPTSLFPSATSKHNTNKLSSIISEETTWAEEANAQRERAKKFAETGKVALMAASIIFLGFVLTRGGKVREGMDEAPSSKVQKLDYFRDFPDPNATPGEAEYIRSNNYNTQNVFAGSILDLAQKGIIEFEPIANEKKNVTILLGKKEMDLKEDERSIYAFLTKAANGSSSITMKEFRKYCERHETSTYNLWQKLKGLSQSQAMVRSLYNKALTKQGGKYAGLGTLYLLLGIGLAAADFIFGVQYGISGLLPFAGVALVAGIYAMAQYSKVASQYNGLTEAGWQEREQWEGLKKYMLDFSLLNEKEVPDLALWEKYLVYATAFGVADKVLKQLKIAYPQLEDDDYMYRHYRTMYYVNHFDVGREFSSSVQRGYSSYVSSQASSGSGGGGGFSGGGGGGFGGGGSGGR